jgi:ribosomal protein S18 acetylase RimI-like enzyme
MVDIRLAGGGDVEALAELNRVVQELHVARAPGRFTRPDARAVAEWFRSMVEDPAVRVWIAEDGGQPAGYVLALTCDRAETPFTSRREYCEIDQIVVARELRRRGLARALVERVLADARSRGIRDVELNSWCFNTEAHEAFRALGFTPQIVRFHRTSW